MKQRDFFQTDKTKDISFRLQQLNRLQDTLLQHERDIYVALKTELNKSAFESLLTEFGMILSDIRYVKRHLRSWARPKRVSTPLTLFGARSFIYSEPYGVVLIISPWNYPFYLTFSPLIGAIAAGNCVILKPSEHTPVASSLLRDIIQKTFSDDYITVVEGDAETSKALLDEKFDYIFFTGSTDVGKQVMTKAAQHLTPVTLELGGKSPCIVDETANISLAAKRITWGKFLNAGQTCIAPDFVLVHKTVKHHLLVELEKAVHALYRTTPLTNENFPRIVNEHHFTRLLRFIDADHVVIGGKSDCKQRLIEPTILTDITWESPIMQEEIFGPILPVLTYTDLEEAIDTLKKQPKPLALYVFSENKRNQRKILSSLSFGGGCINDTIYHIASPHLPFGGVGESGIGNYHGKASFTQFSHSKGILKQTNRFDMPFRYAAMKNSFAILRLLLLRSKK